MNLLQKVLHGAHYFKRLVYEPYQNVYKNTTRKKNKKNHLVILNLKADRIPSQRYTHHVKKHTLNEPILSV